MERTTRELCNTFGVRIIGDRDPGCAARPWAVVFNAFGVIKMAELFTGWHLVRQSQCRVNSNVCPRKHLKRPNREENHNFGRAEYFSRRAEYSARLKKYSRRRKECSRRLKKCCFGLLEHHFPTAVRFPTELSESPPTPKNPQLFSRISVRSAQLSRLGYWRGCRRGDEKTTIF